MKLSKIHIKKVYKNIFVLSIFCLKAMTIFSQNDNNTLFENANQQYSKGNYDKAIELYKSILNNNVESSEVYFNLGNAYYKTNKIGWAILNYEKAKKLSPQDEDIETNLALANLKTEDKIDALPQLFIYNWLDNITDSMSEKSWSVLCIVVVIVSLVLFVIYFLSVTINTKKVFFYLASFSMVIAICLFFFAQHSYHQIKNSVQAIIVSPTTTINGSPTEKSTKLFILHEGTKVSVTDEDNAWVEIKLANGNVGWVLKKDIQRI